MMLAAGWGQVRVDVQTRQEPHTRLKDKHPMQFGVCENKKIIFLQCHWYLSAKTLLGI